MTSPATDLRDLAQAYAVSTDYWDWQGRPVEVSAETVTAVLTAMGVDVSDPAAALARRRDEPWQRMLPATVVATEGQPKPFMVHVDHGSPVTVWVELENGGRRDGLRQLDHGVGPRTVGGRLVGEAAFEVPADLPTGYHTMKARSGDTEAEAHVDRHAGVAGAAARAGRAALLGPRHPALQRPLPRLVGCGRPDRPHRPRGVVGRASSAPTTCW